MYTEEGYYTFRATAEKNKEFHSLVSSSKYADSKDKLILLKNNFIKHLQNNKYYNITIKKVIFTITANKDYLYSIYY